MLQDMPSSLAVEVQQWCSCQKEHMQTSCRLLARKLATLWCLSKWQSADHEGKHSQVDLKLITGVQSRVKQRTAQGRCCQKSDIGSLKEGQYVPAALQHDFGAAEHLALCINISLHVTVPTFGIGLSSPSRNLRRLKYRSTWQSWSV